jgi:hypothetical protein
VYLPISILFKLSKKMYIKVSIFGLLAGSLVMLAINPLLHNNAAIAQGYDNYGENSYYSKCPTDDKKCEGRTGPFRYSLSVQLNFGSLTMIMIKTITIEQEHKVCLDPKSSRSKGKSRSNRFLWNTR